MTMWGVAKRLGLPVLRVRVSIFCLNPFDAMEHDKGRLGGLVHTGVGLDKGLPAVGTEWCQETMSIF